MNTPTTLPACLTRTAADDREEAYKAVGAITPQQHGNLILRAEYAYAEGADSTGDRLTREAKRFVEKPEGYDDALAAIQRREAKAVQSLSATIPDTLGAGMTLVVAARNAAAFANGATQEPAWGSLIQRARLLDAARALVRLALEVAAR